MITVKHIAPLGGHRLRVTFSDGRSGVWDFSAILTRTGPMALPLHDPAFFAQALIEEGAITWPNGYDSCPQATRMQIEEAGMMEPGLVAAE